ncbi:MAG: PilN domain-containing protein [Candidatus Tectomicrobia bacterium]|nr:PilN domain-containing protein [Candidatus Tectomicrobia bacterium]
MIRINLLPAREAKRRIVLRNQLQLTVLLLLLLGVGLSAIAISQRQQRAELEQELVRVETEIASLENIVKEVEAFQSRKDQLQRQIEVVTNLKKNQRRPALVMDALSRSLPNQVWLQQVQEQGVGMKITGKSLNGNVGIAAFMENMGRSPWFGTAELVESKSEVFLNRPVVSFTVTVPLTMPKTTQATT